MKTHESETKTLKRLPIQIRYRAQDYETRYLDDPRVLYIEEFHAQHGDDGFFAFIPNEPQPQSTRGSKWIALGCLALSLASLGWLACRLFGTL